MINIAKLLLLRNLKTLFEWDVKFPEDLKKFEK